MNSSLGFATPWASAADFIAMGGYGLYVWGAFGVTALVMAAELLALRARRKALPGLVDSPGEPTHFYETPHAAPRQTPHEAPHEA